MSGCGALRRTTVKGRAKTLMTHAHSIRGMNCPQPVGLRCFHAPGCDKWKPQVRPQQTGPGKQILCHACVCVCVRCSPVASALCECVPSRASSCCVGVFMQLLRSPVWSPIKFACCILSPFSVVFMEKLLLACRCTNRFLGLPSFS